MKIFNELKTALRDLFHGRPETVPVNVYTVDVQKEASSMPVTDEVVMPDVQAVPVIREKPVRRLNIQEILKSIESSIDSESVVNLPFNTNSAFEDFSEKNKDIVFRYMLPRIGRAIHKDEQLVNLFNFELNSSGISIPQNEFESKLNEIMSWFVSQENYEAAVDCRDLIRKLKVNDAVDQQK